MFKITTPRPSTRSRKRFRREARRHAQELARSGLPERAKTWRRRARNG